MPNALTGYYDVGRNSLAPESQQADPRYWTWNPSIGQWEPTQAYYDLQQNGDPSLGTNVDYSSAGGSGVEHFDPGQNPTLFLNAGSNYADTGGVKAAVPGTDLYNQLRADERTRNQQGVLRVAALVGGGAALGATPWGSGTSGLTTGTGTAIGTDTAYGALPEAGIGAEGVGAGTAAGAGSGWGPAFGTVGAGPPAASGGFLSSLVPGAGGGGGMGLGLADWFNIGSTVLGAYGANRAGNIESSAANAATAEQARQFDLARSDLAPYREAGTKALGNLQDPNTNFLASPDYAFRRSEGQRDLGNSFAARGGAFSGNALKALTQYNQNLAQGEFGDWWNRQAGLAGVGQAATNSGNALGANYASNVGANTMYGANARASGVLNSAGIIGGGLNNFATNYLYRQRYGGLPYNPYQGYGG